jgi:hypothetical protein
MSIKKVVLCSVFFILALIKTQIFAQSDNADKTSMMTEMTAAKMVADFSNCPQYLQLNENQRADIQNIMNDFQKNMEPLQKGLTDKMTELQTQMTQTNLDEGQINETTKEVSDLYDKIFKEYMDVMVKIKGVAGFSLMDCNPDVKKLLSEQQDYLHSTLMSSSQRGLNTSSVQGLQSNSSQGLQTAPNANNQTVSPSSECSGDGKTCAFPLDKIN